MNTITTTLPPTKAWFEGFEAQTICVNDVNIFVRHGGNRRRSALLLLHGFPQTHALWHRVAQQLKDDFFLVMPDLRGYGDSSKQVGLPDHSNHSKRTMANDMVAVMQALGYTDFYLCGHDRGGRVAHRLTLDHAPRVKKLCVIDIAPTLDMYDATNMAFAQAYHHWFHLIQPTPFPETMIASCAQPYLHALLGGWGTGGLKHIEARALADYERCFCQTQAIHCACEDYRASASIDLAHDRQSRQDHQKLSCDTLVMWGERGVVHQLFKPLSLWQAQSSARVKGVVVAAGHFIPEELPQETALHLKDFFNLDHAEAITL